MPIINIGARLCSSGVHFIDQRQPISSNLMINQQTNLSEVVTWPCRRNSKPSFYVVMWKSQHGFELVKDWILRPQGSKRITPSFAIGSGHLKIPKLSKQYDIIRSVQFQKMLAYIYISHLSTLYSPDIFFSNPPLCPLIGQSPGQYVKVGQICRWQGYIKSLIEEYSFQ